jgi:uncharacterized repeat protein (TIGR01451 family)
MRAHHPLGAGNAKLEVQTCPPGVPFNDVSCASHVVDDWSSGTAEMNGITLTKVITDLDAGVLYRWRARAVYDSALSQQGPWRRHVGQALEADVRTDSAAAVLNLYKQVSAAGGVTQNVRVGSVVTYTLVLSNKSGAVASGVVVTDELPTGVDFGGWVVRGGAKPESTDDVTSTIIWGGDVAPRVAHVIQFTANLTRSLEFAGRTITNSAWFSSINTGADSDKATFTVAPAFFAYLPSIQKNWSAPESESPPQVELAGCSIFPNDNVWNTPVDTLPVDANSDLYVATIGADANLHPDFGSGTWNGSRIGIPYVVVASTQPSVAVSFDYDEESDPGPYPIPPNAPIEGGAASDGDRHVLVVERDNCTLYELFYAWPQPDGSWEAGSGAKFDLNSNDLREEGWTSADAAGLPILPGLVRYEEVAAGEIRHALRFTAPQTRRAYVWPARHYASSLTGMEYPPMGQRFRLKASFDISGFSSEVQVILRALKTYGMFLADNGSAWFLSGVPDEGWDNDVLRELRQVQGSDFEAVDESSLMVDPDSGQVKP